jgi:signal transduction histidine kinase
MNDELELLWVQGIQELEAVNRKLREAQVELAYINRVTTMGELTASIAQEVMQPLAAIVSTFSFLQPRRLTCSEKCGACQDGSGHQPIYSGERPTIPGCPILEAVIQNCRP